MQRILREWVDLRRPQGGPGKRKRRQLDTVQIPALRAFGFTLLISMVLAAPSAVPHWVVWFAAAYVVARAGGSPPVAAAERACAVVGGLLR